MATVSLLLTGIWKYDWYLRSAMSICRLVRSTSMLKHLYEAHHHE